MTNMAAAVHRLYVYTLQDESSRASDRGKAMDGLAKMQGLFVDRIQDERGAATHDRSTSELLIDLASRVGLDGLQVEEFQKISGNGIKPAALIVSTPDMTALPEVADTQPPP